VGGRPKRKASFLIVDDDRIFSRATLRRYRAFGNARAVGSLAEAAHAIDRASWTGVVLDVSMPDGSGLHFLERVRNEAQAPPRSVLVCSGLCDPELRSRSTSLSAVFLSKLADPEAHRRFARRSIAAEYVRDEAAERVADIAQDLDLTAMQTRVLALEVSAMPRDRWADTLGIGRNTIKSHINRLCKRAGAATLVDLAGPITHAVMCPDEHTTIH
jgi:DNA-binding NarL/FixJ family response regulator